MSTVEGAPRLGLGSRILIGMVVGSVVGAVAGERVTVLQPIGDLFIRVLVLAAVPLVFFNLLAGLTTLTDLRVLGRLTAKFVTYFFATKLVALMLGIVAMEMFRPGDGMTLRVAVEQQVAAPPSVTQVLMDLVPTNVVRAFAEGNVAQVVVLAVFLGVATLFLGEGPRDRFRSAFDDIARLLRKVVDLILIAAPFGIGALMALTVGRYGAQLFGPVARFVAGVTAAHLVMTALYLTLLKLVAGRSPIAFLKQTGSLWATTVATTSSLASLSVALEVAEKLRLPRSIYAFTLPLGIQINKDGTAILLVSVVLFTAQATGMTLTGADLFSVGLLGLLLSAGSGGIPGGGFVVALIMVEAFHMPLELAGIIGGIYRLVDMGNTTVNVMGNMVGSILVAHSERARIPRAGPRVMKAIAGLITVLGVAASSACGPAPLPLAAATTPPAIVALARASQDDSSAELAAGLALEAAHWLVNRNDVVVRVVNDPSAYSKASFAEVNDRLAIDLVVWMEVRGTTAEPVVSYTVETSSGQASAPKALPKGSDDLAAIPPLIAEDVLSSLKLRMTDAPLPAWPKPPASVYDAFVRALGRAHTKVKTEAERVALFEKVPAAIETYPPAVTELGGAYLDLAGRSSGTEPYYDRSEQILRRAVELDALYPPARQKLASHFAKRGHSEESLKLLQDGLVTHPLFPGNHDDLGYILRYAGLMEASMDSYRRAQELDRSVENLISTQDQITKSLIYLGKYRDALASHDRMESFVARLGRTPDEKEWFYRGVILLYAGDRDQALDAFKRGEALDSTSVWTTFGRAYAGIARGDRDAVAKVLDELEQHVVVDGERHYRLVHFASFLGQSERALHHLETSIRGGFFNAPYIASDPLTTGLRSDPGFAARLAEAQQRHASFKAAAKN